MPDLAALRNEMVEQQLKARGIRDESVLRAMREVPREEFIPPALVEFAYEDAPLPIDEEQTISQPYIVAYMIEALELGPGDRVLDVGTGSGYGAAVLSRVASEVYTIERHESLAHAAETRLRQLGHGNVHVMVGDGTLGWPDAAPFDAIVVAAGGPAVPRPLLQQLRIGGRLVMPAGEITRYQHLLRVRRVAEDKFDTEWLADVRFVPLIGAAGWSEPEVGIVPAVEPEASLPEIVRKNAEPIAAISDVNLEPLFNRIGDARVVLLGEATHGTAEFYDTRARITRELILHKGLRIVAVEADWPDAARIDSFITGIPLEGGEEQPFSRFPTWMWANRQVLDFLLWLKEYNASVTAEKQKVHFYGLDLYSLYSSIQSVLAYLENIDPEAAQVARKRYGCLTPWERDPATYGAAVLNQRYHDCEREVTQMLRDLLQKRMTYSQHDGHRFLDAERNAQVVANAEKYYRVMYYGSRESWNLRDQHMFETLEAVLNHHGPGARAAVWAHNSHIGDASATEMGARGEHNIGQLIKRRLGRKAYSIGFGTDHGTVAAAHDWNQPMQVMQVRPSHPESYERVCHDSGLSAFLLPLRRPADMSLRERLMSQRLERAIGVVYRPETEMQSHYFYAILPRQFDEYIWFDETRAVTPLSTEAAGGMPETFPFGV